MSAAVCCLLPPKLAIEASGDHLGARLGSEFLYPELRRNRAGLAERGFPTYLGQYAHARHRKRGEIHAPRQTSAGWRVLGCYQRGRARYRRMDWVCRATGNSRVGLVGHSAGWAVSVSYQADSQDRESRGWSSPPQRVGYSAPGETIRNCLHRRRS